MSVWQAGKVKVVNLDHYNILDCEYGAHFIGNDMDQYGARVSTKIVEYDDEKKRGLTDSGTAYQLYGKPGLDDDGSYLLGRITKKTKYSLRW